MNLDVVHHGLDGLAHCSLAARRRQMALLDCGDHAAQQVEVVFDPNGKLRVRIMSNIGSGNYIGLIGTKNVVDGKKHMFVASYDGSSLAAGVSMYIDGVAETLSVEKDALTASIIGAGQAFLVGQQQGTPTFYVRGTMGFFQLDKVARSAAYIAAHSSAASLPTIDANTGLAFLFTEGSGVTVHDTSGNGLNGTLTNATMWTP